jgi:DNA-binding winged helix-turn-helix (wHTH) protein/tetratricopeptide (TPR) repeat protein
MSGMPGEPEENCWQFHSFRLDKKNASLWRDDQIVPLRPKNFSALCYLVERHGQLVTKGELLDEVWQRRCVGDAVLKVCINELRHALGDDARTPVYLVTVARRGYRFIAPVTISASQPKKEECTPSATPGNGHGNYLFSRSGCRIPRVMPTAQLASSWQRSLEGARQVLFLTGEPGIGKTTLIDMFLDEVRQRSPMVFRMRCVKHFGQGEALLPMIEAIEKHCRAAEGAELIALLHRHAPIWLAQLPSVLPPPEREALQREIFGASRERMIREGCELLEVMARKVPLILVFEDLHWSDHATLDLLSLLARRSEPARLLAIASCRPIDAGQQAHPLVMIRDELLLCGAGSETALAPFSLDEVNGYLARRFPGIRIPASVGHALFHRTGGLPLFVSDLIEHLVAQHPGWPLSHEPIVEKGLPQGIRRMIENEIDRLSPTEQNLLGAASAIGAHFSTVLLSSVLDMELAEVDRCCDALARRGHILLRDGMEQRADGKVAGSYAFRHALYVETFYQRLAPGQAIRLHFRIGEAVEREGDKQDLKHAAQAALHFEKGWDWSRAISYLALAATRSSQRFANRQAYDYLVRALGMVERLPEERQAEVRMNLLKQSAAIQRSMGEMAGAKADLENMLACAIASGNVRNEVMAFLELSRILAWLDSRKCRERAEQALMRAKVLGDPILQSIAEGIWGGMNLLFGQWRPAHARACYEAMDMARATANPLVLHSRLTQHSYIEILASRYKEACATAEEALALSRTLGDGYMFMIGHYYYGLALLHSGDWGRLREVSEESRRAFERNCDDASLPLRLHSQILIAWLHVEAGDFESAKAFCEEALPQTTGPWATFIRVHFSAIHGRALLGLGDYQGALRCFEVFFQSGKDESLPIARNYFFPACQGACEAWLSLGESGKARHYAGRLHELSIGAPERTYLAISLALLATIGVMEGSLDEADSRLAEALDIVGNAETPLAAWRVYGTAEKFHDLRGQVDLAVQYRFRKQAAIRQLFDSLHDADPLRAGVKDLRDASFFDAAKSEVNRSSMTLSGGPVRSGIPMRASSSQLVFSRRQIPDSGAPTEEMRYLLSVKSRGL